MKKILVGFLLIVMSVVNVLAVESYSFQRGMEAYNNENYDVAIQYFVKDLDENPRNSASYYYIAKSLKYQSEYGKALTVLNKGKDVIVSKDDKVYVLNLQSDIYLELGDSTKALNLLDQALELQPKNSDLYLAKAYIYMGLKKDQQAEEMMKKGYALNPSVNNGAFVAECYIRNKRYSEALKYVEKIEKKESDTSEYAYAIRGRVYAGLKQYDKMTNDILKSLRKSHTRYVYNAISRVEKEASGILIDSLKKEFEKKPKDDYLPFYLGRIYFKLDSLEQACHYYHLSLNLDNSAGVEGYLSDTYLKLGYNDLALEAIDRAIQLDSTFSDFYMKKSTVLHFMGRENEALEAADKDVELSPFSFWSYYRRGVKKYYLGTLDKSLEDLNIAHDLNPKWSWVLYCRANTYKGMGEDVLAKNDYQKSLDLSKDMGTSTDTTDLMLASYYVGKVADADRWADSLMAKKGDAGWEYMDVALLRFHENKEDEAVDLIKKAYDRGFRQYKFLYNSPRFAKFKNNAKFKAVMDECQKKVETNEADYRKKYNMPVSQSDGKSVNSVKN